MVGLGVEQQLLVMKCMTLSILSFFVALGSSLAATTTTTVNVPGSAKSVTVNNPPGGGRHTTIDCGIAAATCYSETTTTTDFVLHQGDKIQISGTTSNGVDFFEVGGYINKSQLANPDGTTSHGYMLSPTWNVE